MATRVIVRTGISLLDKPVMVSVFDTSSGDPVVVNQTVVPPHDEAYFHVSADQSLQITEVNEP